MNFFTTDMKKNTACRYFQQWKHSPGDCIVRYHAAQKLRGRLSEKDVEMIADILANELNTSTNNVIERMQKPWALKQIVSGRWKDWNLPEQDIQQPSRISRLTERITNRKSQNVELLLNIIFDQDRFIYSEDSDIRKSLKVSMATPTLPTSPSTISLSES